MGYWARSLLERRGYVTFRALTTDHSSPLLLDENIRLENITMPFPDAYTKKWYKRGQDLYVLKFLTKVYKDVSTNRTGT